MSGDGWILLVTWVLAPLGVAVLAGLLVIWVLRSKTSNGDGSAGGASYPDQGSGPAGWGPEL